MDASRSLVTARREKTRRIERELREREFYGLANDRIRFLLAEQKRLRNALVKARGRIGEVGLEGWDSTRWRLSGEAVCEINEALDA